MMARAKKAEHFEISWDDSGNRRHQFAFDHGDAQEVARSFIQDHNLNDVAISKITTTIEEIKVQ